MKPSQSLVGKIRRALLVLIPAALFIAASSGAADMYTLTPQPGGVPARSIITAQTVTPTNATICWHGMQGWYAVQTSTNTSDWQTAGVTAATDFNWCLTVTNATGGTNAVFFRLDQNNGYVGSTPCSGCHADKFRQYKTTEHADAYSAIANIPPAVRVSCVVCHTVGFGQPTGFTDTTNTPHLLNVGCENCHGPAAWHKYSDHDLIRPAVTVAAEVCGGCHTDAHHPTYNEWTNSPHVEVTEHVQEYFLDPDPVTGFQRQMSCGPCHSAATRIALLNDYYGRRSVTNVEAGVTNVIAGRTNYVTLPSAHDAAAFGQTCVACHDPHEKYREAQLRNPKFSTNFFTLPTTYAQTNIVTTNFLGVTRTNVYFLNTVFATNYNPDIQICGQCHNSRGADWTSSGRPPHHSSQYNVLIGAIQPGYLNGTDVTQVIGGRFGQSFTAIGPHGKNTNGCAQCHMQRVTQDAPTEENPNYTGHSFDVRYEGCASAECHTSPFQAQGFTLGMQLETTNYIKQLVTLLGQWSTNKAPAITNAFSAYGKYAWEFTSPGELSNPTGTNTFPGTTNLIVGPPAGLQSRIPTPIKQARFNLYVVNNEGSLGVHNPEYTRFLINNAVSNVNYQLSRP